MSVGELVDRSRGLGDGLSGVSGLLQGVSG